MKGFVVSLVCCLPFCIVVVVVVVALCADVSVDITAAGADTELGGDEGTG